MSNIAMSSTATSEERAAGVFHAIGRGLDGLRATFASRSDPRCDSIAPTWGRCDLLTSHIGTHARIRGRQDVVTWS
ncbi:MAG: hypothetical protein R3C39_15095 [Dehalococcoidia bacterium]